MTHKMFSTNFLALVTLFAIFTAFVTFDPKAVAMQNLQSRGFVSLVFADSISAQVRQVELSKYADYLLSTTQELKGEATEQGNGTVSMLQAFFIGEYFRMHGKLDEAAFWYLQSSKAEPTPRYQDDLDYAVRSRLLPDGSLLLHDFTTMEGWMLDKVNSNVNDVVVTSNEGRTSVSFQNQPQQRDTLVYEIYFQRLPLGYHSTISLLTKVNPGAFLTLETRVDGKLTRHLNYQEGTGEWEHFDFVIEGSELNMFKLGFSEPSETANTTNEYYIELDELELTLTE